MSALDSINTIRVIKKIKQECVNKLKDGLFDLDIESTRDMVKETCAYYLEKNAIYDYNIINVKTTSYHSFKFIHKNKRYYLRPTVKDQDGDLYEADDIKVYSKRQAIELWNRLLDIKNTLKVDLMVKPVHPCNVIYMKFKIEKNYK